jgi:predicted RNA binding protein YcfA (HicA-like mRNA interferase family)
VTVPEHAGRIIMPPVLTTILKQAGISAEELRELL